MNGRRLLAVLLSLAVAASATAAVTGFAAAQQANVAISGVNVSPDEPGPGEEFTLTANISNLASSNGAVTVTDVFVRGQESGEEYAWTENLGGISPGNTMSVPISFSIPKTGSKNLRVHAFVETPNENHQRLEYPVLVTVSEANEVLVSVRAPEASVDQESTVNVTVANGDSSAISSVEMLLRGSGSVDDPRRVTGSIESKTDRAFLYDVSFDERGTKTLNATLTYTTGGGVTQTVSDSATFEITNESADTGDQLEGKIRLVGVETSGSGIVTLQGDAANVGGTNVKSVLLRVKDTETVSPMGSSGEYFVGAVNDSKFDTFELIARTTAEATAVPVHVEYIVDGEKKTDTVRINVSSAGASSQPVREEERFPNERRTPVDDRRSGALGGLGGVIVAVLVVVGLGGGAYVFRKRR